MLSFFKILNPVNIFIVAVLSLLFTITISIKENKKSLTHDEWVINRSQTKMISNWKKILSIVPVLAILIILCLQVILAPPNNWDSMTYHLPRVEHWLQNNSVFGYLTQIDRQIWSPRGSEMLLLTVAAFSSSDYLYNTVQFFCLIGILIIVYNYCRERGLSHYKSMLPVYGVLAYPTFLLESVTTQNDVIAALTALVAALSFLQLLMRPNNKYTTLRFVTALSLCFTMKGTTYIIGVLIISFLLYLIFKGVIPVKVLMVSSLTILLINFQLWYENFTKYSSPLAPSTPPEFNTLVTSYGASTMFSNLIRTWTSNLLTFSPGVNEVIISASKSLMTSIGIDPNERGNTWYGGFKPILGFNEDIAGSPILVVTSLALIVVTIAVLARQVKFSRSEAYLLLLACTFFVSTIYLLRWQPWINRLLLPTYLLGLVGIVPVLDQVDLLRSYIRKLFIFFMAGAVAYSISFSLQVVGRPVLATGDNRGTIFTMSDDEMRFINSPWLKEDYLKAVENIRSKKIRVIFLDTGSNSWEYPLWQYTRNMKQEVKIYSILDYPALIDKYRDSAVVVCLEICSYPKVELETIKVNVPQS
jgi:hypothetical protein